MLSLNDDEYQAVMRAAGPVHPTQRSAFLQALAKEFEGHPAIGPGLVHRLAAQLQRQFTVEAHTETPYGPRHKPRQAAG
jgi:hypothetical protein